MKNIQLELNGFKRFALSDIQHFSIEMHDPLQVILGANGSGKSSLLEQMCTPYPPSQHDFLKTGSMSRVIEHQGRRYVLKSEFSPAQRHYFEMDGKVLNDWGTFPVQKNLVKEHFKITSDHHALFLGEERFHQMGPTRRREWFIEICETDYNYAISVYKKLMDKHRDCQGALKTLKRKHSLEVEKLLKPQEQEQILQAVSMLQQLLTLLIEYRKPKEADYSSLDLQFEKLREQQIKDMSTAVQVITRLSGYSLSHLPGLFDRLETFKSKISAEQALLQNASKELTLIGKQVSALEQAGDKSMAELQLQMQTLLNELQACQSKCKVDLQGADPHAALVALEAVQNDLVSAYSELPDNVQRKYSSVGLSEARQTLDKANAELTTLNQALLQTRENIKHMIRHREHPDTQCPSCQYKFSLGYSPEAFVDQTNKETLLVNKIESVLKPQIKLTAEYIEVCQAVAQSYRYIQSAQAACVPLQPYWTIWQEAGFLYSPKNIVSEFNDIRKDLEIQKQAYTAQIKLTEVTKVYDSLKSLGVQDLRLVKERQATLEQTLEFHTERLVQLQTRQAVTQQIYQQLKSVETIKARLDNLTIAVKDNTDQRIEALRREHYNELVRTVQSNLGSKEHLLTQARIQNQLVQTLETQITELAADEKALALGVKTLSPTDGLIAAGLTGFIQAFVQQMNSVIEKVWTYPMLIGACQLDPDSTELDYKFPVFINDESPRPDVSKTSKGQKEMIDLAFLITAMCYMGKNDFPLVLDEIGSSFDTEHRVRLITLLRSLIENKSFDMVYLVSHDYHQYSALAAQVCVLNPDNIIVPTKYNEHVKLK
jgi:DNA repair exonuclease SbcCD ATPase subunit